MFLLVVSAEVNGHDSGPAPGECDDFGKTKRDDDDFYWL